MIRNRRERVLDVALAMLVLLAVTLGGLRIRTTMAGAESAYDPVFVDDWESYATAGNRMGSTDPAVVVIEFSDFQCPFCRAAHADLKRLKDSYDNVAIIYRHFPISASHGYAFAAASASECAAETAAFEVFHDLLFLYQDSIGIMPWVEFARRAGISDLSEFEECVRSGRGAVAVTRDSWEAEKLGITGTPAIMINGRLSIGSLGYDRLRRVVETVLQEGEQ